MPLVLALLLTASYDPQKLTIPPEMMVSAIETQQTAWMQQLAQCESRGSTTIKIWDTNNKWSVGKYQYQYATWLKYSALFGTTRENITDGDLQDKVTSYILNNPQTTGGWRNWYNCSKAIGLDTQY